MLSLLFIGCGISALAQTSQPISVSLDLSDAPRKILHARLSIPVQPGPLTLVYPKWIPGEHGPTGPIDNFAGIVFTANGTTLAWQRDDVNMFAFHLTVPSGVTTLDAKVDFLATAAPTGFSAGASTSANLAMMSWNEVVLYPEGMPASEVTFVPAIKIPEGWKFGTALTPSSTEGGTTNFEPVALNTLIDSPLLAGRFFKEFPLAEEITPKHYLDMAGDGPEDLNVTADQVAAFSNLVREAGALYASRHYNSYHFLVTLSDSVAHFGLEHHQSSDDRVEARTFLDEDSRMLSGDLLPHEFTHSWNGKYRRPAGLVTPDYQEPMKGELLWVYEGLTQYLGDVLAARSGIWTEDQYRSYLAASAAGLDHRPGRTWRDLEDTATSAQILYGASEQWDNWRRSVDYYPEGELIWLDVDTTIRKLSNGKRSLNDFCARFLGIGGNTAPKVLPYTFEDVVSNLNTIQRYDWASFLRERISSKSLHAPLGGIANGGYRIEYNDQQNDFVHAAESHDHGVNAWYSLGMVTSTDETISDVLIGSPAYNAGLGPGMKVVAVNSRRATDELLHQAIRDAKSNTQPIELIVENAGFFKVVKIDYRDGERYPHLVRVERTPDVLDDILKPMVKRPEHRTAE
ncbi:MAG: M61 family metallopeptidase [Acidobacteriaceae bacterium]|nr:M61 family metallopeptidase [Acidobacteriaceae bacterium]MBV9296473.1 M61 family metallopeptidase [Acidobacteriaceae bacterium]